MKNVMKKMMVVMGLAVIPAALQADTIAVDDFNDGSSPNFLAGQFGAWDKDVNDETQTCVDSFDSDIKMGEEGFSLKLDYDVDSPNPAYNGFWMNLGKLNLDTYSSLVFYVRGDKEAGYTTQFKIEFKNEKGEVGTFLVTGVSDEWTKIVVPRRKVAGLSDWSAVTQLVVVFDDVNSTVKDGVIYIDDISFTTDEV